MKTKVKKSKVSGFQEASLTKKIVVTSTVLIFMVGGLLLGVMAIAKIENYDHPFVFAFVFGVIGVGAGMLFARWVKPYALVSARMDYGMSTTMFSTGCAGIFILLGHYVNQRLSVRDVCDKFTITDRVYLPRKGRLVPTYTLYFNIDDRQVPVNCSMKFWTSVDHREAATVCIYKSMVGFDYIVLRDDHY